MKLKNIIGVITVLTLMTDCNEKAKSGHDPLSSSEISSQDKGNELSNGPIAILTLKAGDDMKFDLSELKVREGQTVRIILHHTGTIPASAMGHNVVLLQKGVDIPSFAAACAKSDAPDFDIPADRLKEVVAHTKMIGGGETAEIEFKAPPKGSYAFICSFPGHYAMMNGMFTVE
ncbi:plastocyanin/azurin family copper-binding protein [Epilithonimonas hungarica]|uniref:Azurin n=1 Tax=Epilithonimonas hungarica TaxID=454006 RepID=A0A1G7SSA9_9FLAO|nr:plastocyanin/azurin family copper-binding protein [Epilithonimonas hungarica]SDG25762.1 azurin [Epilithonimonas hungarica]